MSIVRDWIELMLKSEALKKASKELQDQYIWPQRAPYMNDRITSEPRSHDLHTPVAEERSSFVEGLVVQPLLLERRPRGVGMMLMTEECFNDICDWSTSERVAPASERSTDVEQQAEKDNLQLPTEIER